MLDDFISVLMCPNSKEKLSVIKKDELIKILKNGVKELEGNQFLINESKSFLYRISPSGFPLLLPEEGIPIKNILEKNISMNQDNTSTTFSTFKRHKQNLEYVYNEDVQKKPYDIHDPRKKWKAQSVHKPLADGLKPGSVLDVGGGFGLFRHQTKDRFHLNVDISEIRLNLDPGSNKVNGRSEKIPVLDDSFDNVVSSRSMEHCQDVPTTMSELVRCLKPEGRLVVACWREDWPECQKGSVWAVTNFIYFLRKVVAFAKTNPDLLIDRFFYKLKIKKTKSFKHVKNLWGREGHSEYYSRRFNRDAFQKMLEKAGVRIIKKGYCGKDFPGPIEPPAFIVDRFYDEMKYGIFFFFVCEKPKNL